jgi:hypothetical protein
LNFNFLFFSNPLNLPNAALVLTRPKVTQELDVNADEITDAWEFDVDARQQPGRRH